MWEKEWSLTPSIKFKVLEFAINAKSALIQYLKKLVIY